MATIYRDYGAAGSNLDMPAPNNAFEVILHRQVYLATHKGDGPDRLPFMNRSFISFTYGGKAIEDFDLIVTFANNRLDKNGYSSFHDLTTTYDNLEGQLYWGTHYTTSNLTFHLSTDGIDLKQLDEFLHWFLAGVSRELILSEHPNRALMARVSEPPQLSLLPFKHETSMTIAAVDYPVITTLYKGDITLNLIMDDPHWYAKTNILGIEKTINGRQTYLDYWIDTTTEPNKEVWIYNSPDAMKILYEDGIPLGSMIESNMLLGNGAYANVEETNDSKTWSIADTPENPITYTIVDDKKVLDGEGARIHGSVVASDGDGITSVNEEDSPYPIGEYFGVINGAVIEAGAGGITTLSKTLIGHFYYAGTAPAPTIISFILQPQLGNNNYISTPKNSFSSAEGTAPYNVITITSETTLELRFTTPNFLTSYNLVLKIFSEEIDATNGTTAWETIYNAIRDKVRHPAVRAWAIKVMDFYRNASPTIASGNVNNLKTQMQYLLCPKNSTTPYPIKVSFNSKTGEAIGLLQYRTIDGPSPGGNNPFEDYGGVQTVTEDIGDMLLSNYIVIRDRNYPNDSGKIQAWTNSPMGRKYSHMVTHDLATEISQLQIEYLNMYL